DEDEDEDDDDGDDDDDDDEVGASLKLVSRPTHDEKDSEKNIGFVEFHNKVLICADGNTDDQTQGTK
ncbi:hypothetical protein QQZ08_012288, partial [Neonectria magnoliae]